MNSDPSVGSAAGFSSLTDGSAPYETPPPISVLSSLIRATPADCSVFMREIPITDAPQV